MIIVQYALLLLIFALELAALAAYAYWGFHIDKGWAVKIILGIGAPLLAAIIWGAFLSPKASIPVPFALRFLLKAAVFGLAAAALYAAGRGKLAFAFALAVVAVHALSKALGEPPTG